MALGFVLSVCLAYVDRRQIFKDTKLVDEKSPGLGPTEAIQSFGLALVLTALFGSIVTFTHGASLFLQAQEMREQIKKNSLNISHEDIINLFMRSTWAYWLVLTLFTTLACLLIILWLKERIANDLRDLQMQYQSMYVVDIGTGDGDLGSEPKERRTEILYYAIKIQSEIHATFKKAETWPLPSGAATILSVAVFGQIANIAAGLYQLLLPSR
jgi:hypothetical protein